MLFRSRGTCCQPTPPQTEGAPSFAHFAKGWDSTDSSVKGSEAPRSVSATSALERALSPTKKSCHSERRKSIRDSGCSFAVEEPAVSRSNHEPRVPHVSRHLRRHGIPRTHRPWDSGAPRPGKPRLQSHPNPRIKSTESFPHGYPQSPQPPAAPKSDASAPRQPLLQGTGFSPCVRLSLGHRKLARNGRLQSYRSLTTNLVIPNRAEGPMRTCRSTDATSEGWGRGIPCLARSGVRVPEIGLNPCTLLFRG